MAVLALGVGGARRRSETRLLRLVAIAALGPTGRGRLVDGVARSALVASRRTLGGLPLMAGGTCLGRGGLVGCVAAGAAFVRRSGPSGHAGRIPGVATFATGRSGGLMGGVTRRADLVLAACSRYVTMAPGARVDVGGRIAMGRVTFLTVIAVRATGLLRVAGRTSCCAGGKGVRLVTGTASLMARSRSARHQFGLFGVATGTALCGLAHLVRSVAVGASTFVR